MAEKNSSSRSLIVVLLFLLAIVTPFNNCANVPTPTDQVDQVSNRSNLHVEIKNGIGSAAFDSKTGAMTISGTCNAQAFQQNVVWWSIELNGKKVWDSYLAGGEDKLGRCSRNKFSVLVTSPCKLSSQCEMFADAASKVTVSAHISGLYGENLNQLEASSTPFALVRY